MTLFQSQLDRNLPELPSTVRLMVKEDGGSLSAYDPDNDKEVAIADANEQYNFFTNCIALTQRAADNYNAGKTIATGMAVEKWQHWLENFEV